MHTPAHAVHTFTLPPCHLETFAPLLLLCDAWEGLVVAAHTDMGIQVVEVYQCDAVYV